MKKDKTKIIPTHNGLIRLKTISIEEVFEWIEKNPTEENNENINQTDTVKNFVTEIQIPSSPVLPENLKKITHIQNI